jgi:O-antigen/teichoic acid export membrane protein
MLIAGMNFVMTWTDTVVLGVYRSADEVGIYVAAMRLATLVSFILWAGNSILAPKYATLYSNDRIDELQSLVLTITRFMAFLAAFPLIVFLLFASQLLSIFGPEFVFGETSLIVLSIGQFVNTAVGSVGYLLMMTGNEWTFNNIFFAGVILNLILNILLVPSFGIAGAAVATTTSMVIWNISAMIATRMKINIRTLI